MTLLQVIQAGLSRETSKANAEAIQSKANTNVNRLEETARSGLDDRLAQLELGLEEVKRIRKHGKCSSRYKKEEQGNNRSTCDRCTYQHTTDYCPAEGRKCNTCGKEGHFSRSTLCKKARDRHKHLTTRRVDADESIETDSDGDTPGV